MNDLTHFPTLPLPRAGQSRAYWRAPESTSALAHAVAMAAAGLPAPLLVVARDTHAAQQLEGDLRTLGGIDPSLPVLHLPDWETLPFDRFKPAPGHRQPALATLPDWTAAARIVVVKVATLMLRLARAATCWATARPCGRHG